MASSAKGLRLLKVLENMKKSAPSFDVKTVMSKMDLKSAGEGVLKGSFTIEPSMCNVGGSLHGGYISSVIDVFSFYSQLSHPEGRLSWTTTMNIVYLGQALQGETVDVEAKPIKSGNLTIVQTSLQNAKGNILAKGTTTFIAGSEKYQKAFKDYTNFDVYEK
ncbi:acyl-coenzyme A thioesterase 13-like [Anticarsia gemmatalis]|uniref:acyl-coenzyme A thioesterase 13-like n=1 Tax=Anticarsia gemmatalis TaxID=129554 RepID=UPI003F75F278